MEVLIEFTLLIVGCSSDSWQNNTLVLIIYKCIRIFDSYATALLFSKFNIKKLSKRVRATFSCLSRYYPAQHCETKVSWTQGIWGYQPDSCYYLLSTEAYSNILWLVEFITWNHLWTLTRINKQMDVGPIPCPSNKAF